MRRSYREAPRRCPRGNPRGLRQLRLRILTLPTHRVCRPVNAGNETCSGDKRREGHAATKPDLEHMIVRLQRKHLHGKCVHPGVAPVHQETDEFAEKAARLRQMPSNKPWCHLTAFFEKRGVFRPDKNGVKMTFNTAKQRRNYVCRPRSWSQRDCSACGGVAGENLDYPYNIVPTLFVGGTEHVAEVILCPLL